MVPAKRASKSAVPTSESELQCWGHKIVQTFLLRLIISGIQEIKSKITKIQQGFFSLNKAILINHMCLSTVSFPDLTLKTSITKHLELGLGIASPLAKFGPPGCLVWQITLWWTWVFEISAAPGARPKFAAPLSPSIHHSCNTMRCPLGSAPSAVELVMLP